MISIERYAGREASVNSFLLADAANVLVVDLLRNSAEAEALADYVESSGKRLAGIFITHGHPDHYIGLGVFHRRFPDIPVMVASREIRNDIIGFSRWMESVGWLEAEPHMKMKSSENPDGFDYENVIRVLDEPKLRLPLDAAVIEVRSDYSACECGHTTTLRIPEQRVFMAFDLIYNGVHAWCGPGVGLAEINNWIEALNEIEAEIGEEKCAVYGGHGSEGDVTLVQNMREYLQTFIEVTQNAKSRKAAMEQMKQLFPGFAQEDFLLVHSINFHVSSEA